jgi:uncharacterized protein (UPF0332 family)
MAYHDELLKTAGETLSLTKCQATFRRSVSTAYYAVFHLLIYESCQLWSQADRRVLLARQFDHKSMKTASNVIVQKLGKSVSLVEVSLAEVAENFVHLYENRIDCDYDLSFTMTHAEASDLVGLAQATFDEWVKIRTEPIAKDYLYTLLFKEHKRA